jgi:hypothetical protein
MKEKNWLILLVFVLCGLVIGGLLGQLAANVSWLSWLNYGKEFGFSPVTMDLGVVKITLGLLFKSNVASIIGIAIAIFIYRKV